MKGRLERCEELEPWLLGAPFELSLGEVEVEKGVEKGGRERGWKVHLPVEGGFQPLQLPVRETCS